MAHHLVLTVIGDDRPGLVGELSAAISVHQGNWPIERIGEPPPPFSQILTDDQRRQLREQWGEGPTVTVLLPIDGGDHGDDAK